MLVSLSRCSAALRKTAPRLLLSFCTQMQQLSLKGWQCDLFLAWSSGRDTQSYAASLA